MSRVNRLLQFFNISHIFSSLASSSSFFTRRSLSWLVLGSVGGLYSVSALSQSLSSSPYSRYGLGDLQPAGMAQNFSLGGSGIAWRADTLTPSYINVLNPASYAAFRITAIEMGLMSNTTHFQTNDQAFNLNNTSFSYLAVGVPIKRWWGLSFGIMPYSTVGYNIHTTQVRDTLGLIDYLYQGTGGINKAYVGNGFRLLKEKYVQRTGTDLSAGFNANYQFGAINNVRHVFFESPNTYDTRVDQNIRIHDFAFDFGLQLKFRIDSVKKMRNVSTKVGDSTVVVRKRLKTDIEDITFGVGLTFAPPMGLSATQDFLERTYIQPGSYEIIKDTLINNTNQTTIAKIPAKYGIGISINRSYHWNILADYTYQQWSGYSFAGENGGLANSQLASLGFQFQPALRGSYFSIVRYRFGLKYNETYVTVADTKLTEMSFTFGAAFPVAISKVKKHEYDINLYRNYSMVNLGVELGQRGTTSNGLIKESYGRIVLGFTINDRWFQRFKYND
jgi:hypothetical protein